MDFPGRKREGRVTPSDAPRVILSVGRDMNYRVDEHPQEEETDCSEACRDIVRNQWDADTPARQSYRIER